MESIRVQNKDIYRIEVNDKGECIQFDLTDIELPFRLEKSKNMVNDAEQWLKGQILIIGKREDVPGKDGGLSANERAQLEAYREFFRRMRAAIDVLAGKDAAQKIFGEQNYVGMFNDFMEQMAPHFDKMQLKGIDIKKRIEEKYGEKADDEI